MFELFINDDYSYTVIYPDGHSETKYPDDSEVWEWAGFKIVGQVWHDDIAESYDVWIPCEPPPAIYFRADYYKDIVNELKKNYIRTQKDSRQSL